ncbi:hypothetical protein DFH06DRAFT_1341348 [Mycena polygramma]|nr:hypothetical protein DFH06DRAFT_1341348 [Mycena polygramma]
MWHLAALIALALSGVRGHLLPRDDSNETATFSIDPSPTLTNAPVSSAYSVYAQQCGTDLDEIAYSMYPSFTADDGSGPITADAFIDYMNQFDDGWNKDCSSAFDNYNSVLNSVAPPPPPPTLPAQSSAPGPSVATSFSFSGCIPTDLPTAIPSGLIPGGFSIPGGLPGLGGRDNQAATSSCQGSQIPGGGGSATGGTAAPTTTNKNSAYHVHGGLLFSLVALGLLCVVAR